MKLKFFLIILGITTAYTQEKQTQNDSLSVHNLDQVMVIARKKRVKIKEGKTTLDLTNTSLFGSKLLDAILVAPGIQIDRTKKSISFEGKNVLLFIDGRQINITSESVYGYVQSIPTNTIKNIEFDAHPGAKYDADSSMAIMSITTKKKGENSLNFNPYFKYTDFEYHDFTCGGSAFGNYKKIDFSLTYDNYYEKVFNNTNSNQEYFNDAGGIDYTRDDKNREIISETVQNFTAVVGYKNERNEIVVSYLLDVTDPVHKNSIGESNLIYTNPHAVESFVTNKTGGFCNSSSSYDLSYKYSLDSIGSSVRTIIDHTDVKYNNETTSVFSGSTNGTNIQGMNTNANLNSIKIDYNNSDKNRYRIEGGIKYSSAKNDTKNYLTQYNDYRFAINENIFGSYFTVKRNWESFVAKMGVRIENTTLKGDYFDYIANQETAINKNFFRVFPNIYLEYQINKKNSLSFIADSKINRPNYGQYNPFIIVNDPYSVSIGNPELLPAFVYNYNLQYTLNERYSFKVFYTHILNQVTSIVVDNVNDISLNQTINLDYANYYGVNVGGNFDIKKWWNLSYWGQISNVQKSGTLPNRKIDINVHNKYSVSINQQFKLPNDYMINVNAFLNGNDANGINQQLNSYGSISVNSRKDFFNKKLGVELFVEDILNTNSKMELQYSDNLYSSHSKSSFPGRKFGIGLSYSFDSKANKIEPTDGNEEINRATY